MLKSEYVVFDDDVFEKFTSIPGIFCGHSLTGIFGRLDCPQALNAIRRGAMSGRVLSSERNPLRLPATGIAHPCLRDSYHDWRARKCLPASDEKEALGRDNVQLPQPRNQAEDLSRAIDRKQIDAATMDHCDPAQTVVRYVEASDAARLPG